MGVRRHDDDAPVDATLGLDGARTDKLQLPVGTMMFDDRPLAQ